MKVAPQHAGDRPKIAPAHAGPVELPRPPWATSLPRRWRRVKVRPNPYRGKRDRSMLPIALGVLVFVFLVAAAAVWMLHSALR